MDLRGWIAAIAALGVASCMIWAANAIFDRDPHFAELCKLPDSQFSTYFRIARSNGPAAALWLYVHVYEDEDAAVNLIEKYRKCCKETYTSLLASLENNFNIATKTSNANYEKDLLAYITNLRQECPDTIRRESLSERTKDALQGLGLAFVFLMIFLAL